MSFAFVALAAFCNAQKKTVEKMAKTRKTEG